MAKKLLVWLQEVDKEDIALVGGKGANLGEMVRAGFPVPPGFIVTATAFREFLQENNLDIKMQHLLGLIEYDKQKSLEKVSLQIENLIRKGKLSQELVAAVFQAYTTLGGKLSQVRVAIRSSATAEDLPGASFAGQQETYLNVKGEANVLLRIKDCWASLFHPRALFYRHENHIDNKHIAIAVPVQKMVESDASGVLFSINPVNNDREKIVIEAIYGLGELIVQGKITPDHYEVDKKTLEITKKEVVAQKRMLVQKGVENKEIAVPKEKSAKQKITNEQIITLAQLAKKLEHHYYFPQDSEWAIEHDTIYLVQTRPVTTLKPTQPSSTLQSKENVHLKALLTGDAASPGIATGPAKILQSAKEIDRVRDGDVLIAQQTNPDYVSAMKKAVAIVAVKGGRTSHAAIVARELGIPAVVGAIGITDIVKDGEIVTVNGMTGQIFKGGTVGVEEVATAQAKPILTATKVYVNVSEPDIAQKIATRQADGIGLFRAEFMMADIGVHPKKLIHDGRGDAFVAKLAEGIAKTAGAFAPRPVVYRASDFKTNEYRQLTGGKEYEPVEPNPMLGYRGAFRYTHDPEVFQLELEALKHVRNKLGLKNVWLMLPFVRTVKELREVKSLIAANGLYRSPSFQIWMMVEIPSNIILLDDFIEQGIDGVSIGSNDLTMLMLGTDRDNSLVATEFNEQDNALLWAYEHVIKTSHKHHISVSLCGQAASVYPKLLKHLVNLGITSVSVAPDVLETTRAMIQVFEKERVR